MEDFKPPRKLSQSTVNAGASDGCEVFGPDTEKKTSKKDSLLNVLDSDSEESDGEDAQRYRDEERTYDSDSEDITSVAITHDLLEDIIHAWLEKNAINVLKQSLKPAPKKRTIAKKLNDCVPKKAKK